MAFLTLFRVSTGDNWNGIMKVCSLSIPQGTFKKRDRPQRADLCLCTWGVSHSIRYEEDTALGRE